MDRIAAAARLAAGLALAVAAGEATGAAVCSSTPGANDWIVCEATTAADVSVNTSNVVISTTGTSDYGVYLSNTYSSWAQGESANVSIVMTGGSITTTGRSARGVFAWMQDSDGVGDVTIDLTRVAISVAGSSAIGVRNSHSGTGAQVIRMTGGSIEAGNAGVYAYRARGGAQTIELSGGVTISTTGGSAYGVYALRGGTVGDSVLTIRMTGGSVGTQGAYAHGVYVRSTSAGREVPMTIELSGVDVSTMGDYADGVHSWSLADGARDVDVTGGSITTTGAFATGLYAHHQGDTGKLTIDVSGGTTIETSGYHGVHANESTSDGSVITLSDVSIVTRGSSEAVGNVTPIAAVYGQRVGRRGDDDAKGDLVIDLTEVTLTATPTALYGRGVYARDGGLGDIRVNFASGHIRTGGVSGSGVEALQGSALSGPGGSVENHGNWTDDSGRGSIAVTIGAEARVEAPFSVGVAGIVGNPKVGTGRIVIEHAGEIEARSTGILAWASRWSGSTFGDGYEATTDDAARTEPMIHVTSSGDVTVGADVMDDFIRAVVAGADETLSTAEWRVFDAIFEDDEDSDALDTALDALPASYTDDYKAEARSLLASRRAVSRPASEANQALGLPKAGIRALVNTHHQVAGHVKDGDVDPTLDRFWPPLSEEEEATLDAQLAFTDPEREILRAVLAGGEGLEPLLDALPAAYTDDWKDEVRRLALLYNEGDVRVDVTGGTIVSEGHGVDARYAIRHARNGAIEVTVAEGASVTGGVAGIYVAGAGLGDLAEDSEWRTSLKLAEGVDVTGLRRQFVTVHGTVTGGTDAAVHLAGGGVLHVGPTGKVNAGSSGNGVLANGPGAAHVHIEGEVKGAEGEDAAAVRLTSGGSVRVGETGRVLANGAAAAIRADDPDGDTPVATVVLELGTTEGVEDNGGAAREDVLTLLERVVGPVSISGGSGQPVIALGGAAAPGAILEGDAFLKEDGALGGGALDPERFSWGPCPAGQESENTGVCRVRVDVDDDRDGRPDGHGVDATGYDFPRLRTGAIEVTVAEGATVTGGEAGVYVEGAGLGDLARDSEWAGRLDLDDDADVTGLRQQFVTVHGTVTGGTDAAVHLVGGGMLHVGPTGKVLAGSSGLGVLVNDPGVAHVHVEGEVRGAEGEGAAAVHLTGGGSVRVSETGRVLANGAAAAIRADDPDGDTPAAKVVLELGTTEGVEDNGGVAREAVLSLLERVKGPITIENDDGSRGRPVIALVGGAPGATLEGDVLNEDGALGGGALAPERFSWGPCPAGQESENTGVCRVREDVTAGTTIERDGHGVDASGYDFPRYRTGAIEVSVAEGATVTGAEAGIYVEGAGLGDLARDSEWAGRLNLDDDADVTGLRQQFVTVHGTVTGGTDAAVHLVGGGMLYVGPTGKVLAGSSGVGVLVNDPGVAHVHVEGEVRGAEGEGAAAVHLTGGGSVRVSETGRVLANGAGAAIRADDPDGDTPAAKVVLELGVSEGVEDDAGVAREAVQSLLERVKGPIAIENDDGSRGRPVIALVGAGAAPGATLEKNNILNEDGALGGEDLNPETFSWGPCPAGQESGDDGVCRVREDVTAGTTIERDGHGVDASGYDFPRYRSGAIEVSVAEGATVTGGEAGVYVEGAGLGDLARDSEWARRLNLDDDADVTGLRQQFVTVHGTVRGGTDAAVHLVGGGMLYVGPTGKVFAGSSGNGVLVNDPGVAHVHVEGEVRGAEGEDAAAVRLTGGGSVRVSETGRVLANGAGAAIRADDPAGDTPAAKVVLELGVSEGVEDNGGAAREDVLSLLERVKGPITIENDDGSYGRPVIALGDGAAPGAILELVGDVLNEEDRTLGGDVLVPERFLRRPCPPGQEHGDGGVCQDLPPPACPAGQERGDDGECRDLPPPACPPGQERGDDGECRAPPKKLPVGFRCDVAADVGDPRCRLYAALPSILLSMNGLPTYEERTSAARDAGGAWARVEVADGKWKADESTRPNVAYDHRRHGLRVGTDFAVDGVGEGGVSLHGLRGSAEMAQVGKVDLSGYGLGLHATTAFADGFHVDTQAAMTWYEADLESAHAASGALKKGVNGRGYALGVEVGRRMALRAGVSVTPRAGFTWSKADLNDFAEDLRFGARVAVEDARSLKGRVGVGAEMTRGDDMQGSRLFGSLDVEQEFREETEARVSGASPGSSVTPLKAKAERTAYRLAVGGARVWDEGRYALRGSVGYTASGGDNRSLGGGVSFSLRF